MLHLNIVLQSRVSSDFCHLQTWRDRSITQQFERSCHEPPKIRYMDRVNKYHTFDGRLIISKVINKP